MENNKLEEHDEIQSSVYPATVCPEGKFRCSTGRCLAPPLVCDGYDDCGDLSDELSCGESFGGDFLPF